MRQQKQLDILSASFEITVLVDAKSGWELTVYMQISSGLVDYQYNAMKFVPTSRVGLYVLQFESKMSGGAENQAGSSG